MEYWSTGVHGLRNSETPILHHSTTPLLQFEDYHMTTDGIRFVDTTIRDGHQSLWAENMTTGMMLPVAEAMDRAGFDAIELISSSHLKKCVRELKEDPWARVKLVSERITRTPLRLNAGDSAPSISRRARCTACSWNAWPPTASAKRASRRNGTSSKAGPGNATSRATSASIRCRISFTRCRPSTPMNISPSARARRPRSKSPASA